MVDIRNGSDLKVAYEIMIDIQILKPLPGREEVAHIGQLPAGTGLSAGRERCGCITG